MSDSATLRTATCQASQSMGSSREEYGSGLPCPPLIYFVHGIIIYVCQSQSCNASHPLPLWHPLSLLSSSVARRLLHCHCRHLDLILLGALATVLTSRRATTSSACTLTSCMWHSPTCLILSMPRVPAQLVLPHEMLPGPPGAHTCPAQSVGELTPVEKIKPHRTHEPEDKFSLPLCTRVRVGSIVSNSLQPHGL